MPISVTLFTRCLLRDEPLKRWAIDDITSHGEYWSGKIQ